MTLTDVTLEEQMEDNCVSSPELFIIYSRQQATSSVSNGLHR